MVEPCSPFEVEAKCKCKKKIIHYFQHCYYKHLDTSKVELLLLIRIAYLCSPFLVHFQYLWFLVSSAKCQECAVKRGIELDSIPRIARQVGTH